MTRRELIRLIPLAAAAAPLALMAGRSEAAITVRMSCGHLGNGLYCFSHGCPNSMQNADAQ